MSVLRSTRPWVLRSHFRLVSFNDLSNFSMPLDRLLVIVAGDFPILVSLLIILNAFQVFVEVAVAVAQ